MKLDLLIQQTSTNLILLMIKKRIRIEITSINANIRTNVLQELQHRFAFCQEVNGLQFGHFIY